MLLSEAEEILKRKGYMYEGVEDGDMSSYERHMLDTGRKPWWAKKVTNVKKRPTPLKGSNSYTELAMRSVNNPGGRMKPDYGESAWRQDKEYMKELYAEIETRIHELGFDGKTEIVNDHLSCWVECEDGQLDEYRVYSKGNDYIVKWIGHESIFNRKSTDCQTLKDVVDTIKNGIRC